MNAGDAWAFGIAAWLVLLVVFLCGLIWLAHDRLADWRQKRDDEDHQLVDGPAAIKALPPAPDLATVHIERSPLLRVNVEWAERAGRIADEITRLQTRLEQRAGTGRHRPLKERDPRLHAITTETATFDTAELHAMLDGELAPVVEGTRTYSEPAVQLALPLRGVVEYGEVTR